MFNFTIMLYYPDHLHPFTTFPLTSASRSPSLIEINRAIRKNGFEPSKCSASEFRLTGIYFNPDFDIPFIYRP